MGHTAEAVAPMREAVDELARLESDLGLQPEFVALWGSVTYNLGELLHRAGQTADVEAMQARSLELLDRAAAAGDATADQRRRAVRAKLAESRSRK